MFTPCPVSLPERSENHSTRKSVKALSIGMLGGGIERRKKLVRTTDGAAGLVRLAPRTAGQQRVSASGGRNQGTHGRFERGEVPQAARQTDLKISTAQKVLSKHKG